MEVYLIGAVIVIQIFIFLTTWGKISKYKYCLPSKQSLIKETNTIALNEENQETPLVREHSISANFKSNTFNNIQNAINQYLKNNKGATADMALLKNIIDRNVLKLENEINALVPMPLYLGLLGTMGGIIIGLFQIPSVDSSNFADGKGIDVLIEGVKYAMIASAIGVACTSILAGWLFRDAKFKVEEKVNDLLTFLETELLPILKEDVSNNLHNLYQNLAQFNNSFSSGVGQLKSVMDDNKVALLDQVKLIEGLQQIDYNKLTKANLDVFEGMKDLMPQFKLLKDYVEGINTSLNNSQQLTNKLNDIIKRTNKVEDIATFLQDSTNKAISINELVEKYFDDIKDRNQKLVLATNNMEDNAKHAVDHFKTYVEVQIESLKAVTRKEEDLMIKAFEDNRNVLGHLKELTEIKEELKKIRNQPQIAGLASEDVDRIVKEIKGLKFSTNAKSLYHNFKKQLKSLTKSK